MDYKEKYTKLVEQIRKEAGWAKEMAARKKGENLDLFDRGMTFAYESIGSLIQELESN